MTWHLGRVGWAASAVAVVLLSGCGGGGEGSGLAQQGQAVFEANCAVCHGQRAVGTQQGPPLVHEVYEPSHHADESFRNAVSQGVQPHHWEFGPMLPVASVEGEDLDAVIAYVRSLQRDAGIE